MLTDKQINDNWSFLLNEIYNISCETPSAEASILDALSIMCHDLSIDRNVIGSPHLFAGFKNAPAGVSKHHSYKGGLVEHLLEMWNVYNTVECILPKDSTAEVSREKVLMAILVHDLHKAHRTFVYLDDSEKTGINAGRTFAYARTPETMLLTNDQHTAMILADCDVKLPLVVLNSLYSSEGGYKKDPPKEVSALAKLVYILDEFSSNVIYRIKNVRVGIDVTY